MKKAELKTTVYRFEPGDATRYIFALTELAPEAGQVIPGIYGAEQEYILLTLPGKGSGIVMKESLRQLREQAATHVLGYMKGHGFGEVYEYTLVACALAASVLIDNPDDLQTASNIMLVAPEVLSDR